MLHAAFWECTHHVQNDQSSAWKQFSSREDQYLFVCLSCVLCAWQICIKPLAPGWNLQNIIKMQFITTNFSFMDEFQNKPVGSREALTWTEHIIYI